MILDQPFFFHFGQFVGHGTPVDAEVAGELFSVIRNLKGIAAGFLDALGKIRHQPSTDGFGSAVQDASGQIQALAGAHR